MVESQTTIKRFCPKTLADFTATEDFGDFRSLGCYRFNFKDNNVQNSCCILKPSFLVIFTAMAVINPLPCHTHEVRAKPFNTKTVPQKGGKFIRQNTVHGFWGPMFRGLCYYCPPSIVLGPFSSPQYQYAPHVCW